MATITVEGIKCDVTENMGFNHSIGMYAKMVRVPAGVERMAVRARGNKFWSFWGARDRAAPLREAVARGWPKSER